MAVLREQTLGKVKLILTQQRGRNWLCKCFVWWLFLDPCADHELCLFKKIFSLWLLISLCPLRCRKASCHFFILKLSEVTVCRVEPIVPDNLGKFWSSWSWTWPWDEHVWIDIWIYLNSAPLNRKVSPNCCSTWNSHLKNKYKSDL